MAHAEKTRLILTILALLLCLVVACKNESTGGSADGDDNSGAGDIDGFDANNDGDAENSDLDSAETEVEPAEADSAESSELTETEAVEYPLPFSPPLRASGRDIVDADGKVLRLRGLNWSGGEGPDMVMHGLDRGDVHMLARAIAANGFDSIRLVWSNELVEKNPLIAAERLAANPALIGKTALEVMDAVVEALASEGIMVIMNNHISDAKWCCQVGDENELWYNERFSEEAWLEDWKTIARRYRDNPAVVGADLRNEPRLLANWGEEPFGAQYDWAAAAERGGEAVLSEAPDWLVIVEGLGFGRILDGVKDRPIVISAPDKLVYSAHDYPWSQREGIDSEVNSYEELRDNLDKLWGYLLEEGQPYTAPVWVGEIGTCNNCWNNGSESEKLWFSSLMRYMNERNISWSWWMFTQSESWGMFNPENGQPYSPELVEALLGVSAEK